MDTVADVSGRTIAELLSLAGRSAVVAGGAQGLGKGIAPQLAEAAAEHIPSMFSSKLGRVGVPDGIARAVLFCASDMAIFMTGTTLVAGAGESA